MDRYLRDRIENITEKDFWSSIRPSPKLNMAIEAARSGDRERGYALLGQHHAGTLAVEADTVRQNLDSFRRDKTAAVDLKRRADMVLRHEIQGWCAQVIKFGPRIDFNADFGQSGQYGFHYLGWLLPTFHQYVLTGEQQYRDCFLDILGQYYAQRSKLNWRIPNLHPVYYELGAWAKIGVFLPAYAVLARESSMTAAQREASLKLLLGMARSLYRIQKGGYRAGNWQIVGAQASFWMGCVFPEFKESDRWRKRALGIIFSHVNKDFLADGCHSERCWGYGWMSLSAMLNVYEVGLRYDRLGRFKSSLSRLLRKAFRWYAAAVSPTIESLNYGDGRIGSCEAIFTAARKAFPDIDKGPGFLGVDRSKSRILYPSGYAFMTYGDDTDAPFMSINFGGWGGFHTHQDLLDFTIWRYGEPIIEEVGRFGSYDNPLDVFFRTDAAHNQIVIEHSTMNRRDHKGKGVVWHSTGKADFFSAYHTAYESCKAKIQRQIVFVKPDYWVVYDVVDALEKIFQVSSYLHAPRPFSIITRGSARIEGDKSCLVAFAEPGTIRHFTAAVDYGRDDYTVPDGNAPERHRLVSTTWRDVGDRRPITFATLLMPFKGEQVPSASISPLSCEGAQTGRAEAFAVAIGDRKDIIAFNPAGVSEFAVEGRTLTCPMAARIGADWIECPPRQEVPWGRD